MLNASDEPTTNQATFLASQIIFWLIGATDGHAQNYSLFLHSRGGFRLTPFYDVLSVQGAVDRGQLNHRSFRMAMSAGHKRHYRMDEVVGRHFVQTAKAAGMGPTIINRVVSTIMEKAQAATGQARSAMPADFASDVHDSVAAALPARLRLLETAFAEL